MGEPRSDELDGEPRSGAVDTTLTTPPERPERPEPPGGAAEGPAVIDLRSTSEAVDARTGSPPEARGGDGWRREGSGVALRLAMAPSHELDVRLPAMFAGGIAAEPTGEVAIDDEDRGSVNQHLAVHTLEPSGWPTALARAVDLVELSRPTPISRRASVGELLSIQLQDHCTELLANEGGVRAGVSESVHRMRVASRRLRSLLATYRPWLRGSRVERMRGELAQLSQALGRARDTDVLHLRLDQEIAALPQELVVGPVLARVDRQLRAREAAAFEMILTDLDSDRYQLLVEHLGRLARNPPLAPQAKRRASTVLGGRIVADGRRVRRAHAAYKAGRDSGRSELLLHEVRKSAKRARYAAESAEPVLGRAAGRMAKRMQKVQDILGENQDSVAARLLIRHLVFQAHLAGENCFTFGLVYGVEMARASEARTAAEPAIRAALQASEQLARR